jgi:galactonate dehydratase
MDLAFLLSDRRRIGYAAAMKIIRLETFLANGGLRNYLFVRLTTDTGLTGLGEATLEWQEKTVQTLIHEWVEDRVLGEDPYQVESLAERLIRDQYQGGSTVMTAISGVELACWDIIGKAGGKPVYELLGGKQRERLPAYANGWYGGARAPADYAAKAKEVIARGYRAMKFDPFGVAWEAMRPAEMADAAAIVAEVRNAVGNGIELMIEVHGRLCAASAIEMGLRLAEFRPRWYEEPVVPLALEACRDVKAALPFPIATGERLYTIEEYERLYALNACNVSQPDLAHCGGLGVGKKIAALAKASGVEVAPHCSIGPVALAAAVHFGWATPQVVVQENFADYDVPWRTELVRGGAVCKNGEFALPDARGLGVELDEAACARHPYKKNSFPSLWDDRWLKELTKKDATS